MRPYFDFVLYVDLMSNLNPIAPPRSAVAHTNLIRLFEIAPNFEKISPIVQKVISARFFGSSQCTLVKLIRKRKQRIRKQRAILHVLKRTWKVILQVSLFSILLLSKPSQDLVRAPRSCLLNNPALLVRS